MRVVKEEKEDSYDEAEEDDADKENEVHRENFCTICNRQFENRNGFSVHMTKAHGGSRRTRNSNNSNNTINEEPPSKRAKIDGKFYVSSFYWTYTEPLYN